MDVRLNDGTIIRGVPEGITKSELLRRIGKGLEAQGRVGPETPAPIPRPTGRISASQIEERQEFPFPGKAEGPQSEFVQSPPVQATKQAVKEATLPTAGAALLGTVGSLLGPGGTVTGAMIGSAGGEKLNQVLGITPEDDRAVGIAGIAPAFGPASAKLVQKTVGRPIGFVSEKLPITKIARANATMREQVPKFESLGGNILSSRRGVQGLPSGRLYKAVENSGVSVPSSVFSSTKRVMDELATELDGLKSFPEARAAIEQVQRLNQAFVAGGEPIGFAQLVGMRQQLGGAIRQVEGISGVRLRSAKLLFKTLENDLRMLTKSRGDARVPAKLLKRASERAKLEFAVADLEDAVARFTTVNADNTVVNINGLRNWLRDVTNPKNKLYEKNFSDALKRDLPGIKKNLKSLDKITQQFGASPAGPGSIVVRGIGATTGRQVVGAMFGYGAGSAVGMPAPLSAVGGLIGATLPETMVGVLSSPKLLNTLNRMANLGKGELPLKRLAVLSSAVISAAQPRDKTRKTVRSIEGK